MNYRIKKLTIIPEFRLDNAQKNIFIDSSNKAKGDNASFIIAAIYYTVGGEEDDENTFMEFPESDLPADRPRYLGGFH